MYIIIYVEIRKGGEGTLFLLESNRYKESVLLFLHFKLANDEQIKEHLSAKLLISQTELEEHKLTISKMEEVLSDKTRELDRKNMELNGISLERDKIVEQLKLE